MTNHSPTPWTESPTANPSAEFCLADANGSIICRFDHWKGRAEAEQDANVRLIKAAPDLLAALEQLMADLQDTEDDRNPETGEEYSACVAARAAIEKAKGD